MAEPAPYTSQHFDGADRRERRVALQEARTGALWQGEILAGA